MSDWHGPGTLFVRWHSISRIHLFVAFIMVAFCPLALVSARPLEFILSLLLCARVFYLIGKHFGDSAGVAMVGAIGEDEVAAALKQLPPSWKVERNIPLESGGDIDFLLTSPQNTIFLLDAKAHSGVVFYDGMRLCRRIAGRSVAFEKDVMSQVKRQAVQIRTERKLPFVNTVLVFTRAELQAPKEIGLVSVVGLKNLVAHLQAKTVANNPKVVVRSHLKLIAQQRQVSERAIEDELQIEMVD